MPIFIRNIQANILDHFTSEINILSISGLVGEEDYIRLNNFEAFIQNFSQVSESETYLTPLEFGLTINKNKTFTCLEISY